MKIHRNGHRFQVCEGSQTLAVVDNIEDAEAFVQKTFAEKKEEQERLYRRQQEVREKLESANYWTVLTGDVSYEMAMAGLYRLILLGQDNVGDGRARLFARGADAPDNWQKCSEATKARLINHEIQEQSWTQQRIC